MSKYPASMLSHADKIRQNMTIGGNIFSFFRYTVWVFTSCNSGVQEEYTMSAFIWLILMNGIVVSFNIIGF